MAVPRFTRLFVMNYRTVSFKSLRKKHTNIGQISDVKFEFIKDSTYLKPLRMTFKENGIDKYWDIMEIHNAVVILMFNVTRKVLVFVKQFRPGVYYSNIPVELRTKPIDTKKYPIELGITFELCAGLVDKNKPLAQIAKEEVLEECGYNVPLKNFQLFHTYIANIGMSGAVSNFYYCEFTDDMKVSEGGGVGNEMIDVVEMKIEEFEKRVAKPVPASVLIAYYWFITNKYKK